MAQFGRPIEDTYNGDTNPWLDQDANGTDIYNAINESIVDDSTYVESFDAPAVYVTRLLELLDPGTDADHILRVRALRVAGAVTLTVELRQDYVNEGDQGTLITTDDFTLTASFADYEIAIDAGDATNITDYSSLFIRFNPDDDTQIAFTELEVPDHVRRVLVQRAYVEIPHLAETTIFIENRSSTTFNEALLLEELSDLVPDAIYFGGGFTNISGNKYRTWAPAATPKSGFNSGDIRFTYSFAPTQEDRDRIDTVLNMHNGASFTSEQQAEDLDEQNLQDVIGFYNTEDVDEFGEDTLLRRVTRLVLRLHGQSVTTLEDGERPNRFTIDTNFAGARFVPSDTVDDPSSTSDGDVWYNTTLDVLRKNEGTFVKNLADSPVSVVSPTTINGTEDDWDPGIGQIIRASASAASTITGIVNGVDGFMRRFVNIDADPITLEAEGLNSTDINRFLMADGLDITLQTNGQVDLWYDLIVERWRVVLLDIGVAGS